MTNTDVNKISIRLLPDGFSYLNQFHPILPGADALQRIEEALMELHTQGEENEPEEGICSVENTRFCLSPLDTDSHLSEAMYRFTLPPASEEEILLTLTDDRSQVRFTFGMPSRLYHFLQRNWPYLSFSHSLFDLLCQWSGSEAIREDCMIAQASSNSLNLLVYRDGKLTLANRFEFSACSDAIYHMMNCWEQQGLDALDHRLYLLTDVEEIRHNMSIYIKQCES